MEIRIDDLRGTEIRALLEDHLAEMHRNSPPESVHALDLDALRKPDVTFWTAWSGRDAHGLRRAEGARADARRGQVDAHRTRVSPAGCARKAMLTHIIREAEARRYHRLSLETGSMEAFLPARELYESFGFSHCPPFGDYALDPNSVFFTRVLRD